MIQLRLYRLLSKHRQSLTFKGSRAGWGLGLAVSIPVCGPLEAAAHPVKRALLDRHPGSLRDA